MPVGIVKFQRDLDAFARKLDVAVGVVTKKVAIEAFKGIVDRTPVDTGRARASWQMAIGEPGDYVPPEVDKETRNRRARAKRQFGGQVYGDVRLPPVAEFAQVPQPPADVLSQIDGTQKVFITSNLVYIEALEDGHSQSQAPEGMVRVTLAELLISLDQATAQE